ncbi:hypothetical protein UC34_04600 [Pandoraea vervacti]|uniref:Uncharacterized protein n=1 Tax=Pandoraea vervacti TaxID=656178 RepID=A0ABM5SVI3_9BURK|nr:hypothetical protein [Pandoraea vervacti]AJP56477.1 hypothetical protein UC34_04600 [Pandoraea vervacti]
MNVDHQPIAGASAGRSSASVLEPVYRALGWMDVVNIRALNPKCNPTKAAMAAAAVHPDSTFGREIETYIGKTTAGGPARTAEQAIAIRRLAILEDHEVTIDALRDTGLPTDIAVDLLRRLIPRPTGWTLFERIASTPTLTLWAQSVLARQEARAEMAERAGSTGITGTIGATETTETHVADDILTLRILQAFGHDIAVPWSFDTTNKRVYFFSAGADASGSLGRLLDIATLDRPWCHATREACRKAYQALAYCHYGAGRQIWPHWEATHDIWQIHPDPRDATVVDDIVSHNAITCDTERWLRNVTLLGALDVTGHSPLTGADDESDLSDPENVTCDPRRPRIAPGDLRERLATTAAHRRAAQRAALPPPPEPPLTQARSAASAPRPSSAPPATNR